MGKYIGNKEDFEVFIGPFTNKIVTTLGKELRKKQKSCQNHKLEKNTCNNAKCGKYKLLDTAHLSHLNLDRRTIIYNILEQYYKTGENLYEVELNEFLNFYKAAHLPLENKLIMLCRQHHKRYDTFVKKSNPNFIIENYDDFVVEEETIAVETENITSKEIKKILIKQEILEDIENKHQSISKLHGKKDNFFWEFNVPKNSKLGYLICYNQLDKSVVILNYHLNNNLGKLKKDKKKIDIIIPFHNESFIDKHSGIELEVYSSFVII